MDHAYLKIEEQDCPTSSCRAPAGSPCRTGKGKVAAAYHVARFRLVPSLRKAHAPDMKVPPLRSPGTTWVQLPAPSSATAAEAVGSIRIGYARVSTSDQNLATQLASLRAAGVADANLFSEQISTRVARRPELEAAVERAKTLRAAGVGVIFTVHEYKRLGRGLAICAIAEDLRAHGVGLEFLTGELRGEHAPDSVVFTVLAATSGAEREYIRERTLEGHEAARARNVTIGGATVVNDDMLSMAVHLRDQGMSLREIAPRLVITSGAKKGKSPSPATVMRMLRDHDERTGVMGTPSPSA
ncbi:recombinase family protein [Streptomyces sp. NPDC088090]|uniref:recombinase family protein n=1 Tax=Streptomyces sp. NPDC088090 TaxID=3365822 RepID=UPI00385144A4